MSGHDPWATLRDRTRARIGLGRAGDAVPTSATLSLQWAHARARDAIHGRVNFAAIADELSPLSTLLVRSCAADRETYLRRPDLGKRLDDTSRSVLPEGPFELVFVIADGLSAEAVHNQAGPTLLAIRELLPDIQTGPVVLAEQARVAIGDPIGAVMQAEMVVVLIGERPGLTVADSLGAYLTFAPAPGRRDSERNCVSNIHSEGLSPQWAARKIAWLVREALQRRYTGVDLKEAADRSELQAAPGPQSIGSEK